MGQGRAQSYLQNFFGTALRQPDLPGFSHLPRWQTTARCKDFFSADMKDRLADDVVRRLELTLPEQLQQWHYFNRAPVVPDMIVNAASGRAQSHGPLQVNTA